MAYRYVMLQPLQATRPLPHKLLTHAALHGDGVVSSLVSIKAKKRRCSQIVAGADSREKELTATREFLEIYGRKNADTEA